MNWKPPEWLVPPVTKIGRKRPILDRRKKRSSLPNGQRLVPGCEDGIEIMAETRRQSISSSLWFSPILEEKLKEQQSCKRLNFFSTSRGIFQGNLHGNFFPQTPHENEDKTVHNKLPQNQCYVVPYKFPKWAFPTKVPKWYK